MVRQIHPAMLAEKLQNNEAVYLLDVRLPWEHETAALPNSMLIPLHELSSRVDEVEVEKSAFVVVYCHHGVRSLSGAAILENAGFQNVVSLAGGIDLWSDVVDPKVPKY